MRAIHLFPVLPQAVLAFRAEHDPLGDKIPPHITLVFPFEDELSDADLREHVAKQVGSRGRIAFALGSPEIGQGGYVWLPVTQGRSEISDLHDALYTGPLLPHLSSAEAYVPHVTIARTMPTQVNRLHELACTLPGKMNGVLDAVIGERILPDGRSEVLWRIALNETLQRGDPTSLPATAGG